MTLTICTFTLHIIRGGYRVEAPILFFTKQWGVTVGNAGAYEYDPDEI